MTTRLYKHDDVGAPAHSGTSLGQILTILRACLVTGYGTRTAAGWTNPFLDLPNNVGVFQGLAGTGDLFRVDDNANFEFSEIRGFATMSDVNTGTEEYPLLSDLATSTNFIQPNRDTSLVTYDPWWVLASEEFCYFFSRASFSEMSCFFFGAYEKISTDSQVPNYCVSGYNGSSVSATIVNRGIFQTPLLYQRRNQWNDVERHVRLTTSKDLLEWEQPNPLDGRFYFEKIKIRSNLDSPFTLWGYLPDMISMLDGGSEQGFEKTDNSLTINGQTHTVVVSLGTMWAFRYDSDVG
jgi:hypothetical protein